MRQEIDDKLGVDRSLVSIDVNKCHLADIHKTLGDGWNEKGVAELANRLDLPLYDAMAWERADSFLSMFVVSMVAIVPCLVV